MKFQRLLKTEMLINEDMTCFLLDVIFIMLINVKMPTIVGINIYEQDAFRAELS